jgi:hypothetical protein
LFMFFSFLFLSLFLCSSFFLVSFISPSLLGFYWDSQHHDFLSYDS